MGDYVNEQNCRFLDYLDYEILHAIVEKPMNFQIVR